MDLQWQRNKRLLQTIEEMDGIIKELRRDRRSLQDYIAKSIIVSGLPEDASKLTLGDLEQVRSYVSHALDTHTHDLGALQNPLLLQSSDYITEGTAILTKIDALLKEHSND